MFTKALPVETFKKYFRPLGLIETCPKENAADDDLSGNALALTAEHSAARDSTKENAQDDRDTLTPAPLHPGSPRSVKPSHKRKEPENMTTESENDAGKKQAANSTADNNKHAKLLTHDMTSGDMEDPNTRN